MWLQLALAQYSSAFAANYDKKHQRLPYSLSIRLSAWRAFPWLARRVQTLHLAGRRALFLGWGRGYYTLVHPNKGQCSYLIRYDALKWSVKNSLVWKSEG